MPTYPTRRATSAGGVVCDDRDDGQRWVLLIARRNLAGKAQWTLPKGGLEDGETAQQAGIREVREETGFGASITTILGTIDYWFVWREDEVRYHKYVHYYFMWWDGQPAGERDDEAEHVEWVPLETALIRLAHRNERHLVALAAAHPRQDGTASPALDLAPDGTTFPLDAADPDDAVTPAAGPDADPDAHLDDAVTGAALDPGTAGVERS